MTTTPRPDIDPMPEEIRARGEDLRSVLDRPARPVSGAAVLMVGMAVGLGIAAIVGMIVEVLA